MPKLLPFPSSLSRRGRLFSTTLAWKPVRRWSFTELRGNVGAYAVQLARRARLRSVATAGAKDVDYVRSLGADKVLDYHTERFEDEVKDADAVFDLVGGETQMRSFEVLRRGGKLISAVSQPDQDRAKRHGVTAAFFLVNVTTERLRTIAGLIDRGELKTCVGAVISLNNARDAHMMLEGRRSQPRGKIVLNVEAADEITAHGR
jgi:NADPH:quinone reductase-like Zn-dependent oxidoreductase